MCISKCSSELKLSTPNDGLDIKTAVKGSPSVISLVSIWFTPV